MDIAEFKIEDLKPEFTDKSGQVWKLELSYAKARKIKKELKIDFGELALLAPTWGALLYNDNLALKTIWFIISDTAGDLVEDEWIERMNGEVLDKAMEALAASLLNFSRPQLRGYYDNTLTEVTKLFRQGVMEATTNAAKAVQDSIQRAKQAANQKNQKTNRRTPGTKRRG